VGGRAALLTPMMESTSNILGAAVLIVAGLYQWTPFKDTCLSLCQTPVGFILRYGFRNEATGALALGFRHGLYCVGCCWAVMGLLFVAGIMNLFWIACLAALGLAEKVVPMGRLAPRLAGIALIAGGAWFLTQNA
jgi:predicted metal-binding membrane protein